MNTKMLNDGNTSYNFCMLCPLFEVAGGVETLIYRMAKWLEKRGHSVVLVSNKILPQLDDIQIILEDKYWYLDDIWRAKLFLGKLRNLNVNVIKTFHVLDARRGAVLAELQSKPAKLICGVYTPQQFTEEVMGRGVVDDYFRFTTHGKRLICFTDSLTELEKKYGNYNYYNLNIEYFPLPVGSEIHCCRNPKWGKIVSIGRIAEMKGYNFYMVDTTLELVRDGYNVEYHIYGDGENTEELLSYIKQRQASHYVHYRGPSLYTDFSTVVKDAYIFVGMGTALIEAGQNGVPSICAVPFDRKGLTYGKFWEMPFEPQKQKVFFEAKPCKYVIDEIKQILNMNNSEYEKEANNNMVHGQLWSVDSRMLHFMEIVKQCGYYKSKRNYLNQKRLVKFMENNLFRCKKLFNSINS